MISIGIADKVTVDDINTKADDALYSLSNINTKVGSNAYELVDVKNYLSNVPKIRTTVRSITKNESSTYAPLLNVNGRGALLFLSLYITSDRHMVGQIKLTIDDRLIGAGKYDEAHIGTNSTIIPTSKFWSVLDENVRSFNPTDELGNDYELKSGMLYLPFKTNLKIEALFILNSSTSVVCMYEIE